MNSTKEVLQSMYDKLDHFLKTETVVGDVIDLGEVKLIPIITASFGLGGGIGEEESKAGGGGGGLGCRISPDAILVIKDGNVEMMPVHTNKSLDKLIDRVPDLIEKINKAKYESSEEE